MGGGGPLSLPTRPRGLGRESPVPEALEDGDEGSALVGEATEAVWVRHSTQHMHIKSTSEKQTAQQTLIGNNTNTHTTRVNKCEWNTSCKAQHNCPVFSHLETTSKPQHKMMFVCLPFFLLSQTAKYLCTVLSTPLKIWSLTNLATNIWGSPAWTQNFYKTRNTWKVEKAKISSQPISKY